MISSPILEINKLISSFSLIKFIKSSFYITFVPATIILQNLRTMEQMFRVYISSTLTDLKQQRKAVINTILKIDHCHPVASEYFHGPSVNQWDYITEQIDNCDFFIVILAGLYGDYYDDTSKQSLTEKEYLYAKSKKKPIISLILDNKKAESLKGEKVEQEDDKCRKLNSFRALLTAKKNFQVWKNTSELTNEVQDGLYELIKRYKKKHRFTKQVLKIVKTKTINESIKQEEWLSTASEPDGRKNVDRLIVEHNIVTEEIKGTITRELPLPKSDDTKKTWDCTGFLSGESLVLIYHSKELNSVGCSFVRHYKNNIYKGKYVRHNYGTKKLEDVLQEIKKIKSNTKK